MAGGFSPVNESTWFDLSKKKNHGTRTGFAFGAFSRNTRGHRGIKGVIEFDATGVGDRINPNVSLGNSFSIAVLVRKSGEDSWAMLCGESQQEGLFIDPSDTVTYYDSNADHGNNNTALSSDTWYLVCFCVPNTSGAGNFYLNGVADGSTSSGLSTTTISYIGTDPASEAFGGQIGFVGLWERGLNAQEVWRLYQEVKRGFPNLLTRDRRVRGKAAASAAITMVAEAGSYAITGTVVPLLHKPKVNIEAGSYSLTGTAANLEHHRKVTASAGAYSLTGVDVAFLYNQAIIAAAGGYIISGTAANLEFHHKILISAGSYTITGTDVTLTLGKAITVEAGSYVVTGTAANLEFHHKISLVAGSYALTGTVVGLLRKPAIDVETGSYSITGTDIAFIYNQSILVGTGSYPISGTDAKLEYHREINAAAGSYTLTGTDVTLSIGGTILTAEIGSYSITGTVVGLKYHRSLDVASGSYSISGVSAGLTIQKVVVASSGSYLLSGTDVTLQWKQVIVAESGSYSITGSNVALVYSGITTYTVTVAWSTSITVGVFWSFTNSIAVGWNYTVAVRTEIDIDVETDVAIDLSPDSSQTAKSVSGWSLSFELKSLKDQSDTALVTKTTAGGGITLTDAANGLIRVSISASDTQDFTPGLYFWEVTRTDSGSRNRIAFGTARLRPRVVNVL